MRTGLATIFIFSERSRSLHVFAVALPSVVCQ